MASPQCSQNLPSKQLSLHLQKGNVGHVLHKTQAGRKRKEG